MEITKLNLEKLPERVVLQRDYEDAWHRLRQQVVMVQTSFDLLKRVKDFQVPFDPRLMNIEDLHAQLDKRLQAVENDYSLTECEKIDRAERWRKLHKTCVNSVNAILSVLRDYPSLEFSYIEQTQQLVCVSDLESIAEQSAQKEVPSLCFEHSAYIANLRDSVIKLRDFEKSHNLQKIRLEKLLTMDEQQIAEMWAGGAILKNEFFNQHQQILQDSYL